MRVEKIFDCNSKPDKRIVEIMNAFLVKSSQKIIEQLIASE